MQADHLRIVVGDLKPKMFSIKARRCHGVPCLDQNVGAECVGHKPPHLYCIVRNCIVRTQMNLNTNIRMVWGPSSLSANLTLRLLPACSSSSQHCQQHHSPPSRRDSHSHFTNLGWPGLLRRSPCPSRNGPSADSHLNCVDGCRNSRWERQSMGDSDLRRCTSARFLRESVQGRSPRPLPPEQLEPAPSRQANPWRF